MGMTCLEVLSDLCLVGSGLGCIYLSVAAIAVLRFPGGQPAYPFEPAPVTILKPLHGIEPDLASRLASFCTQKYEASIQLVCGVRDLRDPAADKVKELAGSMGGQVELTVDARDHGYNRKVSNLANMFRRARHDILVMADSDIGVDADYLGRVVAYLQRTGVGAVTCLYHGVPAAGIWSRHAALAINAHLLPSIVLALTFGLARPCFGSTIALRRSMLARIGGFQAFADALADDYAIGAAVRSAGYKVFIPRFSIAHNCFEDSMRSLLMHELRAARTIKTLAPVGYCGAVITHPLPLALLSAALGSSQAVSLAVVAVVCRLLLCRSVERAFGLSRQSYLLVPIRDLLSFFVFALSFLGTNVTWRGERYRVTSDGKLTRADDRTVSLEGFPR